MSEIKALKNSAVSKIQSFEITPQDILKKAVKIPGIKIDRKQFLIKELRPYYTKEVVETAIANNPAYAGIDRERIDKIANTVISYETNKVSAISFVAALPGATAMFATIPADIAQYFGMMLRVMQKLAYLYGFEEFDLQEDSINDETMNELLLFLGIMFGVQEANAGVKIIAEAATNKLAKNLAQKPLTQSIYYPIVKKVAVGLGIRMNKQIFSNGVTKIVPVIGGVVSGGLSYATFKPSARRLQNNFKVLSISDPNTYKNID